MTDMPGSLEISTGVKIDMFWFAHLSSHSVSAQTTCISKKCAHVIMNHVHACAHAIMNHAYVCAHAIMNHVYVCAHAIMNHVYVCVAAEVLDSCKKVENQLVSFAAVGVAMDEEAVQEATSTCQAADKLIQVSHGVATSPHQWTPPQPLHELLEPSACLHLLHGVETADNVAFTPPRSCDKLIIPSVPGLISCHIIT